MSILDNDYSEVTNFNEGGGFRMIPCTQLVRFMAPVMMKKKDGSGEYISVDLFYKDDEKADRYIRFNSFNPDKSEKGKQLWKRVLTIAGAKNGTDLKGKYATVVLSPEEYTKADGSIGASYKVYEFGYFSKDGLSATELTEKTEGIKMAKHLLKAVGNYEANRQQVATEMHAAPAASTEETETDMPF